MQCVSRILRHDEWDASTAADRVVLDAEDRRRRRIALTGEKGTHFLLDFAKPVSLRDGDGLELDGGVIVAVVGAPEPLVEISARSPRELAKFAWHLGNRHTEVQIVGDRLRIRRDHVLEDMLRRLGAHLHALEAPFDPEGGAHDVAPNGQAHGHGQHHHHRHGHEA